MTVVKTKDSLRFYDANLSTKNTVKSRSKNRIINNLYSIYFSYFISLFSNTPDFTK